MEGHEGQGGGWKGLALSPGLKEADSESAPEGVRVSASFQVESWRLRAEIGGPRGWLTLADPVTKTSIC